MSTPQGQSNYPRTEAQIEDRNLLHLSLIIIFGIFASTMPQPQVLGKLPLQHLLKGTLHVSQTQMASFFFICGLFWYLKPFAGLLTDAFPLFKTKRRWYLLISSVLAATSWIILGLPMFPHTYQALLLGCIVVNLFMVMMSTVVGAFLVQMGQELQATGRLTSVRQIVSSLCTLIQGPLAGFLASGLFFRAAGVNAVMVLSIFPIAWLFLRERPEAVRNTEAFKNAGQQLQTIFSSRTLWIGLLFIVLYYFAPGFGTPLYFRQNDVLKFSQQQIGNLGVLSGGLGMISALGYGFLIRRVDTRILLFLGIGTAAAGTLLYLIYNNYLAAVLIEAQNGFFSGFAEVCLIDLAARATPKGCEGLGYSLIMSARNLALFGADIVGSYLSDNFKWPFHYLVFLNAGTTALVLFMIPFLPKAVLRGRDGESEKESLERSA